MSSSSREEELEWCRLGMVTGLLLSVTGVTTVVTFPARLIRAVTPPSLRADRDRGSVI